MDKLVLIFRILWPEPHTTDDVWDCWVDPSGQVETCERELSPCHFSVSDAECTVVVKRVRVKLHTGKSDYCDLNDPLACLPEA